MNGSGFTNIELSHLHNALTVALQYNKRQLTYWLEVFKENPSAIACIKMTESEISSYSDLLAKIESIRGF